MDFNVLYIQQLMSHYCTARELQYGIIEEYNLTLEELSSFNDFKDTVDDNFDGLLIRLDLKSFNSKSLYFSKCVELEQSLKNFIDLLKEDNENEGESIVIKNMREVLKSRVYSELEGSLNVENVHSTRKQFNDLVLKDKKPVNRNDQVIKNMASGIEFLLKKPTFNKENLFKLYSILTKDSLDDNLKLKDGEFYRHDGVYVESYEGCPFEKIDECMNSLFCFVNNNLKVKGELMYLLPHIAHYYILYIHPYFDFNGRTARMVSLWVYLLLNNDTYPPFISEAINQTKGRYYSSLAESRNSKNDLTYYLLYIFDISISYYLTYLNIDHINKSLYKKGIVLTNLDKQYIKKILVSCHSEFTYLDFIKWNHIEITKQGAFKILNRFVDYGVLKEVPTSSHSKLFKINRDILKYSK